MTEKIITAEGAADGTALASGTNYGGDVVDLVSKTGGGNLVISSAAGKMARGTRSVRITSTATTDTALIRFTGFTGTDIAADFTYLPDAFPTSDTNIFQTRHASGVLITVVQLADGKIRLNDASSTAVFTSPSALPLTGGPPRFAIYHVKGATTSTGTLKFAVYPNASSSTPLWTPVNLTTANTGTADPAAAQLGKTTNTGAALNCHIDDFRVSDAMTDLPAPFVDPPTVSYTRANVVEIDSNATAGATVTLTVASGSPTSPTSITGPDGSGVFRVVVPDPQSGNIVLNLTATNSAGSATQQVTITPGSGQVIQRDYLTYSGTAWT